MLMQNNNQPDEDEAQRTRRFLEDGARVRVDTVRESRPVTPRVVVPSPLLVEVPDTAEVAGELEADEEAEALVVLEFGHQQEVPDVGLQVFVNARDAGPATPPSAPGFVGTVNFFHDHDDHHEPTVVRFPARGAILRSSVQGPVVLALVPIGLPDRRITTRAIDVTASIELVRATVE
jgi:hypothetical protein